MFLLLVPPVLVQIHEIVQEIDAGGTSPTLG